jgi:DNA polymerase-3 subunit delta
MARLSLSALLRRLGERPASAVIFLHGAEEYRRERAVQSIVETLLDPATRDFNLDQLRGGDATPEGLGSLLATPPMMAEYRIVILREVQGLSPKAREVVEAVVTRPFSGLVLILVATIPSGSKAKFYDTLLSGALSVDFPAVDAEDLPGWLIEHAETEHEVKIELDAARAWSAAIGAELGVLATEVEKAVAYVGDRKRITLEDVKAVGGYIPRVDRWSWIDLVGERKFVAALDQLPELLDSGESGVGLVLAIGTHLLRLGLLVDGGREGLERNVQSNQRWLINKLQPQVRRWTLEQIDRGLTELLRSDRLLKSASLGDRQVMEELLLRLAYDGGQNRDAKWRREGAGVMAGR